VKSTPDAGEPVNGRDCEAPAIVLGVESSCDETSVAVVTRPGRLLSNVVATQIPMHQRFGGVVPEVASRQHVLALSAVANAALNSSTASIEDVDAIAATFGPGLAGPLLVGTSFAQGLAIGLSVPLLAVNHIEAHVLSVWMEGSRKDRPNSESLSPELPMVSLIVSGGHTELWLVEAIGRYRLLGRTVDDAAGEAFDKVARLIGLSYPGGPEIERIAKMISPSDALRLPRALLPGTYDFSFSGLKTAARRIAEARARDCTSDEFRAAVAHGFQESVVDVLTAKLLAATSDFGCRSAAIVGGVAGNQRLRDIAAQRLGVPLYFPGPGLSTDNAAMIANAALLNPRRVEPGYSVRPSWSVAIRA
jgi:N6-L-threonylcarbamoyladenine synthase